MGFYIYIIIKENNDNPFGLQNKVYNIQVFYTKIISKFDADNN